MTTTRRPRGGIGITMRGDKYEATYNIPKAQLPAGAPRTRITAHGDTEQSATMNLLAKLKQGNLNPPEPGVLSPSQEAETSELLGADGRDIKGERKAKYADDLGPLLRDWAQEWLDDWMNQIQESTRNVYVGHLNTYILPYLGDYHLNELSAKKLKTEWWDKIGELKKVRGGIETDEPLLGAFARGNVYKTLRKVLTTAHHKIGTRVSLTEKLIKKPEGNRPETDREITRASQHLIDLFFTNPDKSDPRWSLFILSLLGLRQAERLGLRVSDIHFDDPDGPILEVRKQLDFLKSKGGWYIKDTTKNGQPREIPLFGIFIEALELQLERRQAWAQQPDWHPDPKFADLLFLQEGGRLWTRRQDTPAWHEFVGPGIRGHLARHITGQILAQQGISLDVAMKVLGHKSEALATYYRTISAQQTRTELTRGMGSMTNPPEVIPFPRRA